jgi:hypothetical protein
MHSKFCALFAFIAIALAQNGTFPTDGPFYINSVSNSDLRVDVTDASKEVRGSACLPAHSSHSKVYDVHSGRREQILLSRAPQTRLQVKSGATTKHPAI